MIIRKDYRIFKVLLGKEKASAHARMYFALILPHMDICDIMRLESHDPSIPTPRVNSPLAVRGDPAARSQCVSTPVGALATTSSNCASLAA